MFDKIPILGLFRERMEVRLIVHKELVSATCSMQQIRLESKA